MVQQLLRRLVKPCAACHPAKTGWCSACHARLLRARRTAFALRRTSSPTRPAARSPQRAAPLYTLHGDEPLLEQEAADASAPPHAPRATASAAVFTVAGAHFDWSERCWPPAQPACLPTSRSSKCASPPASRARKAAALQQLAAQAAPGNDSVLTLVMLPRLDKAGQNSSAWFTALDGAGATVQIDPWSAPSCPPGSPSAWHAPGPARGGGRARPAHPAVLCRPRGGQPAGRAPGNQKLALLLPAGRTAARAQVQAAVLNVARYDVFKLVRGRAERQPGALRSACSTACRPRAKPRCWCTGRWPRTSAPCSASSRGGRRQAPAHVAARKPRVGRRASACERVLRAWRRRPSAALLHAAHQVDGIVKGLARLGDPWQALLRLGMALTRPATTGAAPANRTGARPRPAYAR
jgi:DNA polymerase-3 subunit delta